MTLMDFLLLLLPACLVASLLVCLRVRRQAGDLGEETTWTRDGLDVAQITPRIQHVRADYVTESRNHPAHAGAHRAALTAARLSLAGRSFFHHQADVEPSSEPSAETLTSE